MNEEYKETNREKSMRAKRNRFWCDRCDANMTSIIGKCSVCGHRHDPKKKKKKLK